MPQKDTKRHFSPLLSTIGSQALFCQAKAPRKANNYSLQANELAGYNIIDIDKNNE